MSFLKNRLKERLFSLPDDIAAGVKHLSSTVPSSVVLGVAASASPSTVTSPTSPQYEGSRASNVNLDAGSELLEYYQNQWEILHLSAARNSRAAASCDAAIAEISSRYERQLSDVSTLQMLVSQIPQVNAQIEGVLGSLGQLESLFSDVEVALLGLEDTIDARELQERQLEQRFQVALYKERRNAEYEELAARLRSDYAKKKQESDLKELLRQRENQASFQKKFEDDMQKFSGAAPAMRGGGDKDFLDVPLRHDPDASLESVDLNDTTLGAPAGSEQLRPSGSNLLLLPGSGDLESFLNDDVIGDLSPLPRDPDTLRIPEEGDDDEKRCSSVDSVAPIVSSVPVILSSEEEDDEEVAPKVSPSEAAGAAIAASESMYYTPDNTMEKLSEDKDNKKK